MNTNIMELNLNDMAMVNGGDTLDTVAGAATGVAAGIIAGGTAGATIAGAPGAVFGAISCAIGGGVAGGILGFKKIKSWFTKSRKLPKEDSPSTSPIQNRHTPGS